MADIKINLEVKTIDVDITSDDIKALNSSPKELIASPGAGKAILLDNVVLSYKYGGTQYTGGGTMRVQYAGTSTHIMTTLSFDNFLTAGVVDQLRGYPMSSSSGGVNMIANAAIQLACATANFATGNGTMKASIQYRIVNV